VIISYLVLKGLPFPGGVERYTEQVGPRLAARGHDVRVYSIGYRTTVPKVHAGMSIRTVPAIRSRCLEKPSAALVAALRECVSDSDIVHVHAFGPSLFAFLPRLFGKRVVIQGHGVEWQRSKWGPLGRSFLAFAEWASMHIPHALTVVSQTQQEYLRERYAAEAHFIPPGVEAPIRAQPDLVRGLGLAPGEFILFAARLEPEKGLHYLITAYKSVRTAKKLVIAGDNVLDAKYKNEMYRLAGGDPNIVFLGAVAGQLLSELFSNCYLFVLPSELEGLPIAVLEAMSYGCPCLVSDISANREAVGAHALTFVSRDTADLARQLVYALEAPDELQSIGAAGRARVLAKFNWDVVADELEALYASVLAQPGRRKTALSG
jgi:glycosyltransferase involved in cell wall biosynthesis